MKFIVLVGKDDTGKTTTLKSVIGELIAKGAKIIFEVAPQLMKASLKVAVEHPEIKILNCSLNEPSKHIRTYYITNRYTCTST